MMMVPFVAGITMMIVENEKFPEVMAITIGDAAAAVVEAEAEAMITTIIVENQKLIEAMVITIGDVEVVIPVVVFETLTIDVEVVIPVVVFETLTIDVEVGTIVEVVVGAILAITITKIATVALIEEAGVDLKIEIALIGTVVQWITVTIEVGLTTVEEIAVSITGGLVMTADPMEELTAHLDRV